PSLPESHPRAGVEAAPLLWRTALTMRESWGIVGGHHDDRPSQPGAAITTKRTAALKAVANPGTSCFRAAMYKLPSPTSSPSPANAKQPIRPYGTWERSRLRPAAALA